MDWNPKPDSITPFSASQHSLYPNPKPTGVARESEDGGSRRRQLETAGDASVVSESKPTETLTSIKP